ncbi:nitroreductase [Methanocella paludicola SANAE]|uniref:Nitroreductase n=1 Tax=Methanocella paludicola (strain DSM 17711 / JCM 13418 / NBRC 101707 / SANAE) TaxID=304371 RepID=D1YYR4_METPS|nr:nitroreductase family protein [Methanocella paludicola]BAI61586.1 nitroreductase [Methanocella paludicola SANAE]
MEFYEVIKNRKSIRKYTAKKVPEDVLERILEAARWAPSWANRQCTRYVVVDDPALFPNIVSGIVVGWGAPMLIITCADPSNSGHKGGKDYYMLDAGISMEHLILAAAAEGLGTCWIGGMFDEDSVKRALDIPENMRVVAVTPLGYPEENPLKSLVGSAMRSAIRADSRKPITETVFRNKYGRQLK